MRFERWTRQLLMVAVLAGAAAPNGIVAPTVPIGGRTTLIHVGKAAIAEKQGIHVALPKDAGDDWWSEVQQDLQASEYNATRSTGTLPRDATGVFQAANRAQNLRTHFTSQGPRLEPRSGTTAPWSVNLGLSALGRGAALIALGEPEIVATGNRVEYVRPGVVEWYLNDAIGLEQGFAIERPPSGQGDLILRLASSEATPTPTDDGAVDFLTTQGVRVLRYSDLHAFAHDGRELTAWMEVKGRNVDLRVTAGDGDYPVTIDPVATSPSWTAESNQAQTGFGYSVASAGDVNGDGFGDLIVGAPWFDNGQTDEGRAFLYLGSASGLSPSASWTAESNQGLAQFGFSVASAGDVNGDGHGDVVIGASSWDNSQTNAGRAYVYHGSSTGLSSTPAWSVEGDQLNGYLGYSVASAGDVNGDGYADVVIGVWQYDNGQTNEGRALAYHGSAAGLTVAAAWSAEINHAISYFGVSVASAGDVNGDGYSDVVIGADNYEQRGRAYVFHGGASGLSNTPAWIGDTFMLGGYYGTSVSSAGDVNGDGYSDVVIGSPTYGNASGFVGRAYVYYGSASGLSTNPSGFSTIPAWTAQGDQGSGYFGNSVSSAGDVNGDGYGDVLVGAPGYDNGQTNEGRAFLYFGGADGLYGPVWTVEGNQDEAHFGPVASAGDVNGDGYGDIAVGAPQFDNGQIDEGRVFLYHGSVGGLAFPTIVSPQSSAITATTASLGADVTSDGGSPIVSRGVVYAVTATNPDPRIGGVGVTTVTTGGTTGSFTVGVSGLTASTNYSFKGFATSLGTAYTFVAQFTTQAPALAISDVTVAEGNGSGTNAVFTVTLSAPSSQSVSVSAVTSSLSALADVDYAATGPQTLTFPPLVTTQTFSVPIIGDPNGEYDETFQVTLSNPTNASIGDDTGIGTIINDDGPPPSRVFVSITGNDLNVCSTQTTPCRNLAGAISQVAIDGEVIVLSTAEYDTAPILIERGVKITSSSGTVAFVRQPITVNAPGGRVVLRGLTLKGANALTGILLSAADSLSLEDTTIDSWSRGLDVANAAPANVSIVNSVFLSNQTAIRDDGAAGNRVSLRESRFERNATGLDIFSGSFVAASCHFAANTIGIVAGPGSADVRQSEFWGNDVGMLLLNGGTAVIGRLHVFGNTLGLAADAGSAFVSNGTSVIRGNRANTLGPITIIPEQ